MRRWCEASRVFSRGKAVVLAMSSVTRENSSPPSSLVSMEADGGEGSWLALEGRVEEEGLTLENLKLLMLNP